MMGPFDENEDEEMDDNEEHDEEYYENLKLENEIKKIKLSLEHGTDLSGQLSEAELPPEIEGKFLDYISQFESEFAKRKTIKVYELAGSPEWKPSDEIGDDEIDEELAKLVKILRKKGISVDTICDVEPRMMYQFITEELFHHETNDIQIPGMIHGFIYEEFHPNHEHDIKNRCKDFVRQVLDKEDEWQPKFLNLPSEINTINGMLTCDVLIERLGNFRDAFSSFTINDYEIKSVEVDGDSGKLTGTMDYTGVIDGSNDTIDFKGGCEFGMKKIDDWWIIDSIIAPGMGLERRL